MPWSGSGTFTRLYNWVADKAAGINITASRMDADANDIVANGFGNCVTRDGQGSPTANIPMNGFKLTNNANGSASTDLATISQLNAVVSTAMLPVTQSASLVGGFNTLAANGGTVGAGLTVSLGGLAVAAGGANITGNSTVVGTLGVSSALTVNAGGVVVTAGGVSITSGGLTVAAGGATVTGNSNVTGTLGATSTIVSSAGGFKFPDASVQTSASPFSKAFTSSQQAVPAGGASVTVAHGLGGSPFGIQAILLCVTGEQGWAAGQIIELGNIQNLATNTYGVNVGADATNIYVVLAASGIALLNLSTGNNAAITPANWKIVVRAWL